MMKKVLLTKSQHICVAPVDLAAKQKQQQQLIGTAATPIDRSAIEVTRTTSVITNTYMQRQSFKSTYQEIFKLLMRLPDKALQQRVIEAMNNSSDKNVICQNWTKSTQAPLPSPDLRTFNQKPTKTEPTEKSENEPQSEAPPAVIARKRGRKRNTCVPKVVKRSAAQMALQEREEKQLTPVVKKKKVESPKRNPETETKRMSQRQDSVDSNFSITSENVHDMCQFVENYINDDNRVAISKIMLKECLMAGNISVEGLLPIHDAILRDDICGLKRQIYVWSKLRQCSTDFNDLVTADGEDCLQLAITSDCAPEIIQIVLRAGVMPNHIYEDSNNAVHLAVINNIQLDSLRELMRRIDLNLLLEKNDDGYTAMHIAVRSNQYEQAEIICDGIDERVLGKPIYNRTTNEADTATKTADSKNTELSEEKKFAKFYERECEKLEKNKKHDQRLKRELLNTTEARGGNVPLFYAIEGEMQHFCYFLLAHFADPDEENLSGHSPKSYHYEFARILRLNLKVARIMNKVMQLLSN
ncbi:uncharacterized protein LOC115631630 isoform X2 [Scaptodrosophila lebanonensis]|uniref:Uncharacterized protein LOC115631630 isoform X2 n=1 Tax=Drosophila lebanonensis TaxID=7225 RepID=A0A6J2U9Y9_DROLE|nr:uncharacterized protein LOC115631630 isoform X2 [Scaptodrosophila lebanonensis]